MVAQILEVTGLLFRMRGAILCELTYKYDTNYQKLSWVEYTNRSVRNALGMVMSPATREDNSAPGKVTWSATGDDNSTPYCADVLEFSRRHDLRKIRVLCKLPSLTQCYFTQA